MKKNKKSIFIAATGQNAGKTTICLGLLAGLKNRFPSVGFIKPVGQQLIAREDCMLVDKDVVLFKEHFGLLSPYAAMSPVICPPGFTRDYLDHKIEEKKLLKKIKDSFASISKMHDYVLVEGTGHVGVGSIFNINNAKVAKQLGLDMVIIAPGGLGSSFDELVLNIELAESYGVKVRGIILNRVFPDKREMIAEYYIKALKRYNTPILGLIPFLEYLSIPMMKDFEGLLKVPFLSGENHRLRHFKEIKLVAGSLESYLKEKRNNQLIITPACRDDIIKATLTNATNETGMILTGNVSPSKEIQNLIKQSAIPVLYAPYDSFEIMKQITSFTAKIQKDDLPKIEKAIDLIENYVDFDALIN